MGVAWDGVGVVCDGVGVACKDGMVWVWHVRMGWCGCGM